MEEKMENVKKLEKDLKDIIEKEKEALNDAYDDMVIKLQKERDRLQKELRKEYKQAKKYVKKNPEISVGAAIAGGLVAGIVVAKLLNR
jgi:ElaB/YqjD/DUF883 family membrane-anchored ribosome-binding protein